MTNCAKLLAPVETFTSDSGLTTQEVAGIIVTVKQDLRVEMGEPVLVTSLLNQDGRIVYSARDRGCNIAIAQRELQSMTLQLSKHQASTAELTERKLYVKAYGYEWLD